MTYVARSLNCLALAGLAGLTGCLPEKAPRSLMLSGETMGTTYNVTAIGGPKDLDESTVQAAIDRALERVNVSMNNWNPGSEISQFNTAATTDPIDISADLATVMAAADSIHEISGGAFDVTLAPLIELWGFGPRTPESPIPTDAEIAAAMAHVGQGTLVTLKAGDAATLTKATARRSP